jgi:hypothetical protein
MWRQNAADFSRCWGLRECGARPESRGLSLQRMRRELKKTQQLKKNAGRVNAIPAVFPVLHPRLKRSQRKPAESSAIASHWQSRSRTHSPPAWRLGQRRSRLKFQTGWGRNFIQERRESASTMRVQSHRRHSRSKVAAAVCAILIMRPKFRRADRPAAASDLPQAGPSMRADVSRRDFDSEAPATFRPWNVRNRPALSRDGGSTWLRNSIPRHTTGMR